MIITLTTDFGLKDPFVGAMKGVILSIHEAIQVVDITHEIPSYDVTEASIVIFDVCRYFPAGTIHVVVVDPGVGTARRPIALCVRDQTFIAPDNGVLSLVGDSGTARHITNFSLFHQPVSSTFQGRDIFAPVAAHLAAGTNFDSVGPIVKDLVRHSVLQSPTIIRVDKFGNLTTNLRRGQLGSGFVIRIGGVEVRRLLSSYADAVPGEIFAIEGSAGLIELSVNRGSAADGLNLRRGAEFEVETGALNQ